MDVSIKNPWHNVDIGDKQPQIVNIIVEIPKGSKAKYELDKKSGLLKLDRILSSAVHYPANYGFIPQTYCPDNDPLDILVFCSEDVEPMCIMEARVIGMMEMIDNGEIDDKVIAVAAKDKAMDHLQKLSDVPKHQLQEIHRFFEDYKKLQNKKVKVDKFLEREEAYNIIEESIALYKNKFGCSETEKQT